MYIKIEEKYRIAMQLDVSRRTFASVVSVKNVYLDYH